MADAHPLVLRAAHWVSGAPGGHGAVRELATRILRARAQRRCCFRVFTLLAVLALAVSTWILSSPAPPPRADRQSGPRAELPGYYLKNAVLTDYDAAGMPSIRIEAERIDQIDHGTEVALRQRPRRLSGARAARTGTWSGDGGHVEPGGKIIDVAGNVRLQGEATEHAGTRRDAHRRADATTFPSRIATTKSDVRIEFGAHTLTAPRPRAQI